MSKNWDFLGSSDIQISVSNEEILPKAPEHWSVNHHRLNKLSLMNYDDCVLIVNGVELFLKANQGFNSGNNDPRVTSLKIKEDGVQFNWIGAC